MGLSPSSACTATELVPLHPYKMPVVHELCDTDYEARGNFVNWYFPVVHDGEIYSTILFSAAT
jgi:hypothetical protein